MKAPAAISSRDGIVFQPIGTICTPHRLAEQTPVQREFSLPPIRQSKGGKA